MKPTTQDRASAEGVLLPSYTPRWLPWLKGISAVTAFLFTITSVIPSGYASQAPAQTIRKQHLRGEAIQENPAAQSGLEESLRGNRARGITRRAFLNKTAAATAAGLSVSLLGITLTPEEAASQELPGPVQQQLRRFLAARRITGAKPVMPANLTQRPAGFQGFDFNGLYTEYEPAGDRDQPLTQFGRIWPYGDALILQELTASYRANRAAGRTEDARRDRAEAIRLMNKLVRLGKAEQALGFEGGWHFSYNTNGDNFIHPVAPTGNTLWVVAALSYAMRELGDDTHLDWVNRLMERLLDRLQVNDPKDLRDGLLQAGLYTFDNTGAPRLNPRTQRPFEVDDREYIDGMSYHVYRGDPNRVLEDVATEHQFDAMFTIADLIRTNEAAREGARGRLAGNRLDRMVRSYRRLAENVNKLWVTDEKNGDHFITGMERVQGEWRLNRSVAVDNNSWALMILPHNEEMAWEALEYVRRHFIVRQRVGDMQDLPAGARFSADETVEGVSFFARDFMDRFIRALVPAGDPGRALWPRMIHPEATYGYIQFLRRFAERTQNADRRRTASDLARRLTRGMQRLQELYGGKLPNATLRAPLFSTLNAITPAATALNVALNSRFLMPELPKALQGIRIAPRPARAGAEESPRSSANATAPASNLWMNRPAAVAPAEAGLAAAASGAEEKPAGITRRQFMKGSILTAAGATMGTGLMQAIPDVNGVLPTGRSLGGTWMLAQPGEGIQTRVFQVQGLQVPVNLLELGSGSRPIKASELSSRVLMNLGHGISAVDPEHALYDSEGSTAQQPVTVTPPTLFTHFPSTEALARVEQSWDSVATLFAGKAGTWTAPRTGARELVVPLWDPWNLRKFSNAQKERFFKGMRGQRILYNTEGALLWKGYEAYPSAKAVSEEVARHILQAHLAGAKTSPLMGGKNWTLSSGRNDALQHIEMVANSYRLFDWDQVWLDLEVWTSDEWVTTLRQLEKLKKDLEEGQGDPARIRGEMALREAHLRTLAWQWYQFHLEALDRIPYRPSKLYTFVPTPESSNPAEDPWAFTRILKEVLDEHPGAAFNRTRIEFVPMGYQPAERMGQAVIWARAALGVPGEAAAFNLLAMPGAPKETLYDEFLANPEAAGRQLRAAVAASESKTIFLHVGNVEGAMAMGTPARVLSKDRLLQDPVFLHHVDQLGPLARFFVGEPFTPLIRERAHLPYPRSSWEELQRNVSSFGQGLSTGPFGAASPYRAGLTLKRIVIGNLTFELDMIPGGTESMFLRVVRLAEGEVTAVGKPEITKVEILRGVKENAKPITENVIGTSAGLFIPASSEPLTLRITAKRDPSLDRRPWQAARFDVATRIGGGYVGSGSTTQSEEWGEMYFGYGEDVATVELPIPSPGSGITLYNIKLVNEKREVVEWVGSGQDPIILASAWPYLVEKSLKPHQGDLDRLAGQLAGPEYQGKSDDQLMREGRHDLVSARRTLGLNPVGIALGGHAQGIARVRVDEGADPALLDRRIQSLRASGVSTLSLRIPDLEREALNILRQSDQGIPGAALFLNARPDLIRWIQAINQAAHRNGMDVYLELNGEMLQSIADSEEARARERRARGRQRLISTGADVMSVIIDINDRTGLGLTGFLLYNPVSEQQRRVAEINLVDRIDALLIVAGPPADVANPWRISTVKSLYTEILPLFDADGTAVPDQRIADKALAVAEADEMEKPPVSHRSSKALFLEAGSLAKTVERLDALPKVSSGGIAREALERRTRVPTADALKRQGIPAGRIEEAKEYARTVSQEALTEALADPAHADHWVAQAVVGAWAGDLERAQDSQHQPRFITDTELFLESMAGVQPLPMIYSGQGYSETELAALPEQYVAKEKGIPIAVNLTHHGNLEYAPYKVTLTGFHHETQKRVNLQALVYLKRDRTTRLVFEVPPLPEGTFTYRITTISSMIESVRGWLPGNLLPLERNLSIDGGMVQIVASEADAQRLTDQNAPALITEARQRLLTRMGWIQLLRSLTTGTPMEDLTPVLLEEYRQRFINRFDLVANVNFVEQPLPDGLVDLTPEIGPRPDIPARVEQAAVAARQAQERARQEVLDRFARTGQVEVLDLTSRVQPDWRHRLLVNTAEALSYLTAGYALFKGIAWVAGNWAERVRSLGTLRGERPEPSAGRPEARVVTTQTIVSTGSGDGPRNTESDRPASTVGRFNRATQVGTSFSILSRKQAEKGMTIGPGEPEKQAKPDDLAELGIFSRELIGKSLEVRSEKEVGRVDARILAGTRFTDNDWLAQVRGVLDRLTRLGAMVQGADALALPTAPTWYNVRITLPDDVSREVWREVKNLRRLIGGAFVRQSDANTLQVDRRFFRVSESNTSEEIQRYFQRLYADSAKRLTPERLQGLWINQDINAELYGEVDAKRLPKPLVAPPIHLDWRPWTMVEKAYGADLWKEIRTLRAKEGWGAVLRKIFWRDIKRYSMGGIFLAIPLFFLATWLGVPALFAGIGAALMTMGAPLMWSVRLGLEKRNRVDMTKAAWSPMLPLVTWGMWGALGLLFVIIGPLAAALGGLGLAVPAVTAVLYHLLVGLTILILLDKFGTSNLPGGRFTTLFAAAAISGLLFVVGVPGMIAAFAASGVAAWWLTLMAFSLRLTALTLFYITHTVQSVAFLVLDTLAVPVRVIVRQEGQTRPSGWKTAAMVAAAGAVAAGVIYGLPMVLPALAGAGWAAKAAAGVAVISVAVSSAASFSFLFEIDGMKEPSKNPLSALLLRTKLILSDTLVPVMVTWQVLGYESSMVMRALQDTIARRSNVAHPVGFGLGLTMLFLVGIILMGSSFPFLVTGLGLVLVLFNFALNLVYMAVDLDLGRIGIGGTVGALLVAAGLAISAVVLGGGSAALWVAVGILAAMALLNTAYYLFTRDPNWKSSLGWLVWAAAGTALLIPGITAFVGAHALLGLVGIFLFFHVIPAVLLWIVLLVVTAGLKGEAATERARQFLHDNWFVRGIDRFFTHFHGLADVLFLMRDSSGDPITLSDPETQLLGTWEQRGRWYSGDIFVKMFQWAGYRIGVSMLHWRHQRLSKKEEFGDLMERLLASRDRSSHSAGLWRLLEDWVIEKWTGMTAGPPITGIVPIEGVDAEKFQDDLDRDISPLLAGADGRFVTHLPGVDNPPALVLPFKVQAAKGEDDIVDVTLKDEVSFMRFTTRNNETKLAKGQKLAMLRSWMYGEGELRLVPHEEGTALRLSIEPRNGEEYAFFSEREMEVKHHLDTAQAALREREGVVGNSQIEALTPDTYTRGRRTEDRMTPTAKFWRLLPEIVQLVVPGGEPQLKDSPWSGPGRAPFGRLLGLGSENLLDTQEPSGKRPRFTHEEISVEALEKGLDQLRGESFAGAEERGVAREAVRFAGQAAKELLAGFQGHPFVRAFLHITWDPTATPQTDLIHTAPYTNAAEPYYTRAGVRFRGTRAWGFTVKDFAQREKPVMNEQTIEVLLGMTAEQMGALIVRQYIEDKRAKRTQLSLTRYVRSLAATQSSTDTLYDMLMDPNADMGAKWAEPLSQLHLLTGAALDQEADQWARYVHQLRMNDGKSATGFQDLSRADRDRLTAEAKAAIRETANFSREFRRGRLHLYNVRSFWHRFFTGLLNGVGIGTIAAFLWSGPAGLAVGIGVGAGVAVLSFLLTHWGRSRRGLVIGGSAVLMALGAMARTGVLLPNIGNPAAWAVVGIGAAIMALSGILIYIFNSGKGLDSVRNLAKIGIGYGSIAGVPLMFFLAPATFGAVLFGIAVGLWAAFSNGLVPALWMSGGRNWLWMGGAAFMVSWILFSTFGVPVFLPVLLAAPALWPSLVIGALTAAVFWIFGRLDPPYSRDVRILARLFGRDPGQFAGYWDSSTWRLMPGLPWMEGLTYFRIPLWKRGGVIPADALPLSMMEALLTLNIPERQAPISAFNFLRWRRAYALMEQITKAEDTLGGYVGVADLWRGMRRGASGTGAPLPPADVMAEQFMIHLAGEMSQLDLSIPRSAEEALGEGLRTGHRMLFRSPLLTGDSSAHRGDLVDEKGNERGVTVLKVDPVTDDAGRTVIRDKFQVRLDPENERAKPEFPELTVNRDGKVLEGPYKNGLLATPYRVLDHLWGMRPFEMLQMKFPTLAHQVPNLTNQLSGWTAYRLTMDRGGLFAPGWMENAWETGTLLDPDFSARAVEAMEWKTRQLARLLYAAGVGAAPSTIAQLQSSSDRAAPILTADDLTAAIMGALSREAGRFGVIADKWSKASDRLEKAISSIPEMKGIVADVEKITGAVSGVKALTAAGPVALKMESTETLINLAKVIEVMEGDRSKGKKGVLEHVERMLTEKLPADRRDVLLEIQSALSEIEGTLGGDLSVRLWTGRGRLEGVQNVLKARESVSKVPATIELIKGSSTTLKELLDKVVEQGTIDNAGLDSLVGFGGTLKQVSEQAGNLQKGIASAVAFQRELPDAKAIGKNLGNLIQLIGTTRNLFQKEDVYKSIQQGDVVISMRKISEAQKGWPETEQVLKELPAAARSLKGSADGVDLFMALADAVTTVKLPKKPVVAIPPEPSGESGKPPTAAGAEQSFEEQLTRLMGESDRFSLSELTRWAASQGKSQAELFEAMRQAGPSVPEPGEEGRWRSFYRVLTPEGAPTDRIKSFLAVKQEGDWHDGSGVLIFTPDGEVLLQHQLRDGKLNLSAGGHRELGHTEEETAVEETLQETALKLDPARLHVVRNPLEGSNGLWRYVAEKDYGAAPGYDEQGIYRFKAPESFVVRNSHITHLYLYRLTPAEWAQFQEQFHRAQNKGRIEEAAGFVTMKGADLLETIRSDPGQYSPYLQRFFAGSLGDFLLKEAQKLSAAAGAEEQKERTVASMVSAMSPQEMAAVMQALERIAEGPDVDAAIQAKAEQVGIREEASHRAVSAVEPAGGLYAPADAAAPAVFLFDDPRSWGFALLVAKAGAPVAVLADAISQAAGMKELFRKAGVPEGQYAVVSREAFGGDEQAARKALEGRFPPGVSFVTVPRGTSLADIERFLHDHGIIFYSNAAAGAEEVDRYIESLA